MCTWVCVKVYVCVFAGACVCVHWVVCVLCSVYVYVCFVCVCVWVAHCVGLCVRMCAFMSWVSAWVRALVRACVHTYGRACMYLCIFVGIENFMAIWSISLILDQANCFLRVHISHNEKVKSGSLFRECQFEIPYDFLCPST